MLLPWDSYEPRPFRWSAPGDPVDLAPGSLAQGICIAIVAGPYFRNLADNNAFTYAPVTPVGNVWGQCGFQFYGPNPMVFSAGYDPLTTSTGDGLGDFTVVILANPSTADTSACLFAIGPYHSNSGALRLFANLSRTGTTLSGAFSMQCINGSGVGAQAASVIPSSRLFNCYGGRRAGTANSVWVNGGNATTASDTSVASILGTTPSMYIGESQYQNLVTGSDLAVLLAWNRALSDAEMTAVTSDPFSVFLFDEDLLMAQMGGASVAPPASSNGPMISLIM